MGLSKIRKPHSSTAKSVDIPDSHGHIFDSMSHNDPTPGSGFPGSCSSEGKAGKGGVERLFLRQSRYGAMTDGYRPNTFAGIQMYLIHS